jgi:ketosteroid isomerase-like protein
MSEENLQLVRNVYDGWIEGDVNRALESLEESAVWEAIADAPDAGTYRGHAGARRYMEDWIQDFDLTAMDFNEVIGGEDWLVIAQCARTRGKGSGIETELSYAVAYRFRDGKITEITEFRTKEEALAAAKARDRGTPR